ncbi:V4R domain-containing protein [Candidatus Magnetomonas plexicatena]|uniref:V4R domain-containing protein n=1 Tax=Candidatus Magnetomonas plexicatena TaxID=2552947 RepID=UPI001C744022|nr:4-vinyl reductase [Nitrospirales bacterium LBB_01]
MFKEEREEPMFDWSMIGDVNGGRPNLGATMDVAVYRLMQFTLRDVIIQEFDVKTAERVFYKAGELAGRELFKAAVTQKTDFNAFVKELQELLVKLKIGVLRIEEADMNKMEFTLTVAEDLDCSGLPVCEETICTYDEGFISGLLLEFSGKKFDVKETDCWCSGDRVCRFKVKPAA